MRMLAILTTLSFAIATGDAHVQPTTPVRTGVPDLTIGGENESRDQYIFQTVSGLAFDPRGRIVVTDLTENAVRVYQPNGTFAFGVGRKGAGPGEYVNPIGAAFSPDGMLWVQDESNRRFNAYTLGSTSATFALTARYDFDRPVMNRFQPIAFDGSGHVIGIGSFHGATAVERHPARYAIDRSGRTVSVDTIAEPPADSLGNLQVTAKHGEGATASVVTNFYYPLYGPEFAFAQSPAGATVRAVTSRYDVAWFDAGGKLLRTIRRNVLGPALSTREHKLAQGRIDSFVSATKSSAAQLPPVPEHKVPIRAIAFDQMGRLWIERYVADGTPREADLYDAMGKQIAVMRWPANTRILDYATVAARGNQVLGVGTDSLDTPRVVRLTFK